MILLCPIFYAVKLPDTVHGAKHFSLGGAYKSFQVVTALALTAFIPSPLLHLPPFITILLLSQQWNNDSFSISSLSFF